MCCGLRLCSTGPRQLSLQAEPVGRAYNAETLDVEKIQEGHRRGHVAVAEQLLHGADVAAVIEQVDREGVPERLASRRLGKLRPQSSFLEGALEYGRVQVVAPTVAGLAVEVMARGWEYPLPAQFP